MGTCPPVSGSARLPEHGRRVVWVLFLSWHYALSAWGVATWM